MLYNYLKIAWRNLTKNKVYSFINIAGLAIGLACAILITLWIQDERSFDRFHNNGDQLYRVMANLNWGTESTIPDVPFNLNAALKKDLPEVKYVADLSEDNILLTTGNTHYKEKGFYTTGDFLRMFSFPLLKGDVSTALRSPDQIVITQKLARKYFGDTDPVGKVISINNTDVFTVTAILKDIPASSSLQFDWLIPFEYYRKKNTWLEKWGSYATNMYVMLTPGTSLDRINVKLQHFLQIAKNDPGDKRRNFFTAFP